MKPKFDINSFELLNNDEIKFECEICGGEFISSKKYLRRALGITTTSNKSSLRFCSRVCSGISHNVCIEVECLNCGSRVNRRPKEIGKNNFCSQSCSATYNNKHKMTGNRRSKMEIWIEEELKGKYDFEIIFNGKEAINSELDIYIPSLGLAFELNGIFHYEPIYGEEKLKNIVNNDNRKFQACLENKIELCVIDASGSKNFKPERDKKYLDIIESVIKRKLKLTSFP